MADFAWTNFTHWILIDNKVRLLFRAFISADKDFDGKVDEGEFEGMISAAAAFPQKFGLEFWQGSGKDQFAAIDENGDGAVSFDEWLGFAYNHYKTQSLATAFDKLDKDTFVKDCKNVGDTGSDAYRKIYWFSWKCFQVLTVHIIPCSRVLTLFAAGC